MGDTERVLLGRLIEEASSAFSSPLDDPDTKMLERSETGNFASEQVIRACLELILINLIRTGGTGEERVSSTIREKSGSGYLYKNCCVSEQEYPQQNHPK